MGMPPTVDRKLYAALKSILPVSRGTLYPCKTLIRRIKRCNHKIRRYYLSLLEYNHLGPGDQWIVDHYPRLQKEVTGFCREMKGVYFPAGQREFLPDWYLFLKTALREPTFPISTRSVMELVRIFEHSRPLTNAEQDYTVPLLRAAAVSLLAESIGRLEKADDKMIERAMTAFYAAGEIDGEKINENLNQLERILRQDPALIYTKQDKRTRALYRFKTAQTAYWRGMDETVLARLYIEEAKRRGNIHVGFPIYEDYQKRRPTVWAADNYFRLLFFLPAILSFLLSGLCGNILWMPLLYLPCYEILRPLTERLAMRKSEVSYPPRLDFQGRIPDDAKTLVTLSVLLPLKTGMEDFRERLTDLALSCPPENAGVCVLADLPSAHGKTAEADRGQLLQAKKIIRELNRSYGNKLVLLVRNRHYSRTEQEYTGWERKRGAITGLVELIGGKPQELAVFCGNTDMVYGARYLLALDGDTGLTVDCIPELVSIACHPFNRPVVDSKRQAVVQGYGILAPRIVPDLASSMRSAFTRIMCGVGGISSYDASCPELYQDLYGEGIFTGKGLIDIDVYRQLLPKRFEEETVLSHDILEGSLMRTLFVGDVELTDCFPKDGPGFLKRLHRWIRGDFQNMPFLFRKVRFYQGVQDNPLSFLSRFKLFDNLRRAVTPSLAMACIAAALLPVHMAAVVSCMAGLFCTAAPYLYSVWRMLAGGAFSSLALRYYSGALPKSLELLARAMVCLLILPQLSYTGLDAAIRGVYRRYISKRKMLEWTTAAQDADTKGGILPEIRFYLPQLLAGIIFVWVGNPALQALGTLYLLAVPLLHFASFPQKKKGFIPKAVRDQLTEEIRRMLLFYEDYAVESEHYLPPDNVQEAPLFAVARRTSPTNIGMMLLSYLTARDSGIITTEKLFTRVELSLIHI